MEQYRYTGQHPVPDEQGELVHPLDVREFDEEPAWGPWELVSEPGEGPSPVPAPEEPAALKAAADAEKAAADAGLAGSAPSVSPLAKPLNSEGM